MRYSEITDLNEDQTKNYHFKAVIMAGPPGVGKTTVANELFGRTSLSFVDPDQVLLQLRKEQAGEDDHAEVARRTDNMLKANMWKRTGLLIDGTGRNHEKIMALLQQLGKFNYHICMVYVIADQETTIERIKKRHEETGRDVTPDFIQKTWNVAIPTARLYKSILKDNFFLYVNNGDTKYDQQNEKVKAAVHRWLNDNMDDYSSPRLRSQILKSVNA